MPDVTVRVEGAAELRKALRIAADVGLKKELTTANRGAAETVVKAALPHVPVRSGRLKGSVRALASQASGRAVAGNARVAHAGAIHWGRTRGNVGSPPGNRMGRNVIRGRPFLWDAAQKNMVRVAREYEAAIERLIDTVTRSMGG